LNILDERRPALALGQLAGPKCLQAFLACGVASGHALDHVGGELDALLAGQRQPERVGGVDERLPHRRDAGSIRAGTD